MPFTAIRRGALNELLGRDILSQCTPFELDDECLHGATAHVARGVARAIATSSSALFLYFAHITPRQKTISDEQILIILGNYRPRTPPRACVPCSPPICLSGALSRHHHAHASQHELTTSFPLLLNEEALDITRWPKKRCRCSTLRCALDYARLSTGQASAIFSAGRASRASAPQFPYQHRDSPPSPCRSMINTIFAQYSRHFQTAFQLKSFSKVSRLAYRLPADATKGLRSTSRSANIDAYF